MSDTVGLRQDPSPDGPVTATPNAGVPDDAATADLVGETAGAPTTSGRVPVPEPVADDPTVGTGSVFAIGCLVLVVVVLVIGGVLALIL